MAVDYNLPKDVLTLKFIREHQGELAFQMQYQNNIIPAGIAKFKQDWLEASVEKWHKSKQLGPIPMRKFMGVDIGGEDTVSDWCVFSVIGIDKSGIIYTLEQIRTHASLNRQVEIIKALDETHNVSRIGIDSSAQQKLITSAWMKDNPGLPITAIKPSRTNDRETRTDRLSILFETNRICIDPQFSHLLDELMLYPRAKHDDCIDALSFALEASREGGFINWDTASEAIITKRYYNFRTL
jgi:predicted phage terminase large subunit-like protein